MFDIPNAKRVRRNELDSPSSSRASSPDLDILNKLRERTQFDLIETTTTIPPTIEDEAASDEELAFNLFAPTTNPTTTTSTSVPQTIRLRSPTPPEDKPPGFVDPTRNPSFYFTGPLTAEKKAEYTSIALSGADVLALSKQPCPGCAYPWKLIHLPASAGKSLAPTSKAEADFLPDEERERKRKRLGKKARVKKRVKAEKARVKKEEKERSAEDKEKLEREKRARRNREKKFKKRARDKAKKTANGGAGGDDNDDDDNAGSGSGGEDGGDE